MSTDGGSSSGMQSGAEGSSSSGDAVSSAAEATSSGEIAEGSSDGMGETISSWEVAEGSSTDSSGDMAEGSSSTGVEDPWCGNKVVEAGEECDDGNENPYDQCKDCVRARYVFVTSQVWPGDLGGVPGADTKCQAAAANGVLEGTYRAWVGSVGSAPASWMDDFVGAFVTPCGYTVAKGWDTIKSGSLSHEINCDEYGAISSPGGRVWTNVTTGGFVSHPFTDCNGWNSFDIDFLGRVGLVGAWDEAWTSDQNVICDFAAHLYCFQVD
jgi:hypothetical protein